MSLDEDDSNAIAGDVNVEPNLLTGDEMDLPSSIENIRGGGTEDDAKLSSSKPAAAASKREMMAFALPALGIFLVNPLLSNIDNAFVGRTVGSEGLAALSPATLCTDQVLYLFSFLARATTGLVSRAYASGSAHDGEGNAEGAREAASAPLTVSLLIGLVLSGLYAVFTPSLLSNMQVNPTLISKASSYIYWRGAIAWAALAQACCLQILLATRDAITPLKIVTTAAALNVVGDYIFCINPLRWGCAGAAAATSIVTLLSSSLMIQALKRKSLLPKIRLPTRAEVGSLVEFMGPLMMITITRLLGFVYMQRAASNLGDLKSLAAFQLCTNIVSFFLLFGEPLSQLSQTKLPALVDREDGEGLLANLKSVLTLGFGASLLVGSLAFVVARFLTGKISGHCSFGGTVCLLHGGQCHYGGYRGWRYAGIQGLWLDVVLRYIDLPCPGWSIEECHKSQCYICHIYIPSWSLWTSMRVKSSDGQRSHRQGYIKNLEGQEGFPQGAVNWLL